MPNSCAFLRSPPRPPADFRLTGRLKWASLAHEPLWAQQEGAPSGAKARGLAYERKFHEHMTARCGPMYVQSPWFVYKEHGTNGPRWCQPDGLLIDIERGVIYILEAKLKHCAQAWWQLFWRYIPVIRTAFCPNGEFTIVPVEVCRYFDPATRVPQKPRHCSTLGAARPNDFNIYQWSP